MSFHSARNPRVTSYPVMAHTVSVGYACFCRRLNDVQFQPAFAQPVKRTPFFSIEEGRFIKERSVKGVLDIDVCNIKDGNTLLVFNKDVILPPAIPHWAVDAFLINTDVVNPESRLPREELAYALPSVQLDYEANLTDLSHNVSLQEQLKLNDEQIKKVNGCQDGFKMQMLGSMPVHGIVKDIDQNLLLESFVQCYPAVLMKQMYLPLYY